jgi:hypothetical protein
MFDPSSLSMKVASPLIDHELAGVDETQGGSMRMTRKLRDSSKDEPKTRTSIFLPEKGLFSVIRHYVSFSPAQMILRVASSK